MVWWVEQIRHSCWLTGGTPQQLRAAHRASLPKPKKRIRKKGLYDAVRDEHRQNLQNLGHRVHITSEAFHGPVVAELAAIRSSPTRLALYQDHSALSALSQSSAPQPRSALRPPALLPLQRARVTLEDASGRRGPPVQRPNDFTGVGPAAPEGHICMKMVSPVAGRHGADRNFPVDVQALAMHLKKKTIGGVRSGESYKDMQSRFAVRNNTYATASPTNGGRLGRQPRWRLTPEGRAQLRTILEKSLQKFLIDAAKPSKMSQLQRAAVMIKVMLCPAGGHAEAGLQQGHEAARWFKAACGNSQAGQVPFRCNLIRCREVNRDGHSVRLAYERVPYCHTRRPLPFGGQVDVGMVDSLTFWDLACECIEGQEPLPNKVVFAQVRYTPFRGDGFIVADDCAHVLSQEVALEVAEAADKGPHPAGPPDSVDWDDGVLPTKKRQRRLQLRRRRWRWTTWARRLLAFKKR